MGPLKHNIVLSYFGLLCPLLWHLHRKTPVTLKLFSLCQALRWLWLTWSLWHFVGCGESIGLCAGSSTPTNLSLDSFKPNELQELTV